ncbi:PTS sugar transporter subunit IIA [candidate division KSB1 bacterium]|nr:MAG: PTS sugar transporter subunit IIA [candidate division KSB1 bacterium]
MNLRDLLSVDVIKIPLASKEKYQIIEELVDVLNDAGRIKNRDMVLQAVFARERVMSTGMGNGVAIPHAKTDGVRELVLAFGVTREDIDFEAIDEKPVRIVFLLAGPTEQTGLHLKALSHISRLMHRKEFRKKLAAVQSADEVLAAIAEEERNYFTF